MLRIGVFVSLLVFLGAQTAFAQTVVWRAADNPHVINGTVAIPPTMTVVMEPGVSVWVNPNSTLRVEGQLTGQGTAANRISITGQDNLSSAMRVFGTLNLNFTNVRCPTEAEPGGSLLFADCHFDVNGFVLTREGYLFDRAPYLQFDRCVFTGTGNLFSVNLTVDHCQVVLRDVTFRNGAYAFILYAYVYLDRVSVDGAIQDGITLLLDGPHYLNNLTITNSARAALYLGGGNWGVNYFLGPNNTLQNNGYLMFLNSGGLLPGSTLPTTGNGDNLIWALGGDWRGDTLWAPMSVPYRIGLPIYHSGNWTILPGVRVKMGPEGRIWDETGGMDFRGSPITPIVFERLDPAQSWNDIHTDVQFGGRLLNCIVDGSRNGVNGGRTFVDDCLFRNNLIATQGVTLVTGSDYLNNLVGHDASAGNLNGGLNHPNSFVGNQVAVRSIYGFDIDCRNNWWDSPTGPTYSGNPGGTGDVIEGFVQRLLPFLTAPPGRSDTRPVVRLKKPSFLLEPGSKFTLTWDSEDDRGIVSHKILVSPTGHPADFQTVATLPGTQRAYELIVPNSGWVPFLRVVAVDAAGHEGWDQWSGITPDGQVATDITLTSDVAGRTFKGGDHVPVTWTANLLDLTANDAYGFLVLDAEQGFIPLGGWFATSGRLPLDAKMPHISTDSARFAVRVSGSLNHQKWFFSAPFAIRPDPRMGDQPPSVTLLSPQAGQSFDAGSAVPITWSASDDEALRSFDLFASYDGGRTWHSLAKDLPGSATGYTWQTAPGTGFANVRVRVVARDLRFQNSSDGANRSFSIGSAPPSGPTLTSLTLNPTSVTGGNPSTGTVTLSGAAPAGGAVVSLSSNNTAVATVPTSVTVAAGATSATFTVTTKSVTASTSVTLSTSYGGITKTAALTVSPAPVKDTVTVQRAVYTRSKQQLSVQVTSTSATATLKAYVTATGMFIGTLKNNGGGRYGGQFKWASNPQNITVKSSLGGSATKAVTVK